MTVRRWLRMLVPSALGVCVFLLPVSYRGAFTIPMGVANDLLNDWLSAWLPGLVLAVLAVSALISVLAPVLPAHWYRRYPELGPLIRVSRLWLSLRVAALLLGCAIVLELGPEVIWGQATGRVVLYELATAIVTLFLVAAFLIPLLTDFGLMEMVGALLSPLFRRSFTLPGRAAVDASASWFSAAAVGILITSQQYLSGFYSAREAAVIAASFSIVSLPFCLLIATVLGVEERFFEYYLVIALVGIVTAMILPRIPPLSRIPDTWISEHEPEAEVGGGLKTQLRRGLADALERAERAPGPRAYLRSALFNLLEIWFSLLPGVIVVGLAGLIVAEHTPIVELLSWPLIPLLELLGLPEAESAAPTMLVGFADMFLPAAMGQHIGSELTRFVIAGISISQLIYMSEVGILIIRSPIPLGFMALLKIFALRTLIALPLFVLAGRLLGLE